MCYDSFRSAIVDDSLCDFSSIDPVVLSVAIKWQKPHNLLRLSGFLSNSKFYGESRLCAISYLFLYYNVSVKQFQTPVWLYFMQSHRGFSFFIFFFRCFIFWLCRFLERKSAKIPLNVHFFWRQKKRTKEKPARRRFLFCFAQRRLRKTRHCCRRWIIWATMPQTSHSAIALFASHITKSAQCALTPYVLLM